MSVPLGVVRLVCIVEFSGSDALLEHLDVDRRVLSAVWRETDFRTQSLFLSHHIARRHYAQTPSPSSP